MFKRRRGSPVDRPASAQASYDDRGSKPLGKGKVPESPASAGKNRSSVKKKDSGGKIKRGGSFRIGSFRKSRPPIEVVTGSFQNVASITTDGHDPRCRQIEFNLGREPHKDVGFTIERRTRAAPAASSQQSRSPGTKKDKKKAKTNAADQPADQQQESGIFVTGLSPGGIVSEQRLLSLDDEIVSVNGLNVSAFNDTHDVRMLLSACTRVSLTVIPSSTASPAYVPGEVQRELFPDVLDYDGSPQARHKSPTGDVKQENGVGDHHDGVVNGSNGILTSTDRQPPSDGNNTKRGVEEASSPSKSPESNASTLVDESGTVSKDGAATNGHDEEASASAGTAVIQARKARPGRELKRRNSVLQSSGIADLNGDSTQMQDMVTVFVDQADTIDPEKKQALLAQCLAEEFDLKFFEDTDFKLDWDGL